MVPEAGAKEKGLPGNGQPFSGITSAQAYPVRCTQGPGIRGRSTRGTRSISAKSSPCLFDQLAERFGLTHGQIGQNLAVELDAGLVQAVNKA